MSLNEVEQILQKRGISPNKVLGQNFLIEPSLYPKLANYAALDRSNVVLDAGAGFGFLARFLSDKCKAVIAVEKDPVVTSVLREQVKSISNITVVEGDVLKVELPRFNKVISLPPYYLSTDLVLWILKKKVDCAVLVVQKEFAERLTAPVGVEQYSWLTVVVTNLAEFQILDSVPKELFHPVPEVDSVILTIKPHTTEQFQVKDPAAFTRLVKSLFTERNKKLAKAITPYLKSNLKLDKAASERLAQTLPYRTRRVRELSPHEFGEIANALPN